MDKNPVGRPTKYKPEYCQMLIDHFSILTEREVELPHYNPDGSIKWVDKKTECNDLPCFHEFADKIGVEEGTMLDWCKVHTKFRQAYTRAKKLQKFFLIKNGLKGNYNANFAIFCAKNITDMSDRIEVDNRQVNVNVDERDLEGKTSQEISQYYNTLLGHNTE